MKKEIKEKIAEEQYNHYKDFASKSIWFIITIVYLSIQTKNYPSAWIGIAILIGIWVYLYFQMNKIHNKWMETIGGKNWREEYEKY